MTTEIRYFSRILLFIWIGSFFLSLPALAAAEYLGGEPVLVASVEGRNEYLPGSDAVLVVVIENRATNDLVVFPTGRVPAGEQPSTAKLLRIGLGTGDAPVIIRTDPQMVGDLAAGTRLEVPFSVKFLQNAPGGVYTLPVSLEYRSFSFADQRGQETVAFSYVNSSATIPLQVKVTPRMSIGVARTEAGNLTAGNEGNIVLLIRNTGSLSGNGSVARLSRHQDSPIVPLVGTSYLGEFPPGAENMARFKVEVQDGAQASVYPVDVMVDYLDPRGDTVTTVPVTIGVPVQGSIEFEIVSGGFSMNRGETREIEVIYRNAGPVAVRSAQARISAVDPFSSGKDTSSLGDLAPGQESRAVFILSADKSATVKEYGLESEVRYRDDLDNRLISDPMKVRISVTERTGIGVIIGNPLYMTVIAALLIGIGYFVYSRRKASQKKEG